MIGARFGGRAWIGRALIAIGLACLIVYSVVTVHTWRFQRAAKIKVDEMVTMERPVAPRVRVPNEPKPLQTGEIIGRVDIPQAQPVGGGRGRRRRQDAQECGRAPSRHASSVAAARQRRAGRSSRRIVPPARKNSHRG